jgi:ATP-dependent helicase/nuclease subunit B
MAADMVERHTVQASTAGAGSLHAVSIERAGYTGREHVFVIGLDVDNFPGRSAEDPILLDVERQQLSVNLDLKSPQATDRIWHLIRAGGMAHGRVYFGTSVFNAEREEAVVYPSPFFQSVAKQLEVDYLHPPPLSLAPFPLDDTNVLLPQRRRSDYQDVVGSHFPWMEAGTAAARARKAPRFSEYDGWRRLFSESDGEARRMPVPLLFALRTRYPEAGLLRGRSDEMAGSARFRDATP